MSSFPGLQEYFDVQDVLFEERPWAILATDKLAGYMAQVAVVGHKCEKHDVVQFLDEEDALLGVCWWCKDKIPESIQALWKMLNWEHIPQMRVYATDEKWAEMKPQTRFTKTRTFVGHSTAEHQKNHTQVDSATRALSNNKTSCVRNEKAYKKVRHHLAPKKSSYTFHPSRDKKQTIVGRYKGR